MKSTAYIGQIVTARIDRPVGSAHPKHGYIYPVNYGFIPNTVSGDGEELDAYVLTIASPIEEFTGECIAVIKRTTEEDDKLILVPIGVRLSKEEIWQEVAFQEAYFQSITLLNKDSSQ